MTRTRVLIIGGYGVFGGRIVDLLCDEPRLALIVAGRSKRRAEEFVRARTAKAHLEAALFDRDANVHSALAALGPAIVVDASGPFQAYGAGRYRIVEACIELGVHYLDLADGSDFVAGVGALDAAARARGVFVLSGVSSFPVLTAAVVRYLTKDLRQVRTIRAGLAPSPFAGVGRNVIRAVASYAGRAVQIRRHGRATVAYPFTESAYFTIGPPGHVPLPTRRFSLVDVPDLRVFAELWPEVDTVWMGAGPVPEILHRVLVLCAWLVRGGLARSLLWLAPAMELVTNTIRWGEHRGGLIVEVVGEDHGHRPVQRSWHLLAEGDDGPLIPSMAVEAIVRKVLDGRLPAVGARPAVAELDVADYERLFAVRSIHTGVIEERNSGPLYERLLGSVWDELPGEIRAMHDVNGVAEAAGTATVTRGENFLAKLVAIAAGFPVAASGIPVVVQFRVSNSAEIWTRRFGQRSFASRQFAGVGRCARLLCERFGPLTFAIALVYRDARLALVLRRWSLLGLPLPLRLAPRIEAYESVSGGRFRFYVDIRHALTGLIVRYQGELSSPQRESS